VYFLLGLPLTKFIKGMAEKNTEGNNMVLTHYLSGQTGKSQNTLNMIAGFWVWIRTRNIITRQEC
jgi:hypothetical protein